MSIALVLGGAACLQSDIEAALGLGEYQGVVACNDAGVYWPGRLDGFTSLHSDKLARIWLPTRLKKGYPRPAMVKGARTTADKALVPPMDGFIEHLFAGQGIGGSSGLLALKMALIDLGFDRAVLCGIPMDQSPHFYGGEGWESAEGFRRGWESVMPAIADRTRSMSGWTAERLGVPSERWVAGGAE